MKKILISIVLGFILNGCVGTRQNIITNWDTSNRSDEQFKYDLLECQNHASIITKGGGGILYATDEYKKIRDKCLKTKGYKIIIDNINTKLYKFPQSLERCKYEALKSSENVIHQNKIIKACVLQDGFLLNLKEAE